MAPEHPEALKPEGLIDPLEHVLGYQLRRAMLVTITALTESYEALGLRQTEAIIIRFVAANPGCNQSAIGRALGVKRTNMVPIVAGLEARGLLIRTQADGRSNALFLTADGETALARISEVGREHEARFFGDVPADLRAALLGLCHAIRSKA